MSPSEVHVESLDQGLVTSQDAATLDPGELTRADNVVYFPSDPSIHKVRGRTRYNAVAISGSASIKGLRYLAFDSSDNILVAHSGTRYDFSVLNNAETGTFALLASGVGSGSTLDAVQYNNRHYLFNGVGDANGQNSVVKQDQTTRPHGLLPVASPATLAFVAGAWSSALGTGNYFLITTEVVGPGSSDEIESDNQLPDSLVPSLLYTSSNIGSQSIQVTRPTTTNSAATHWRAYISPRQDNTTPVPPRNQFKLAATQAIGSTTAIIGNTAGTIQRFPGTVGAGTWTNPANAQQDNNIGATVATDGAQQIYTNFGFGVAGTVQGIDVLIKARTPAWTSSNGYPLIQISLTKDGVTAVGSNQTRWMLSSSWFVYASAPAGSDMWGTTWSAAEVNAATFGLILKATKTGSGAMPSIEVDYVSVRVYTVGTSSTDQIVSGNVFATTSVNVAGLTTILGSHGKPPVATTGDVFEGQLVTNDVTDRSIIRYSLPDGVDYFPLHYFVNFETKETDIVTLVKRLGNVLLVGMKTMVFRVNYLPRESDAEFDRGRCYEVLSEHHGIAGAQAATVVTMPGGSTVLFLVSYAGIHMTDGFQFETVTDDVDWANTVSLPASANGWVDYLQQSVLVDYPLAYQLWFYYTPTGATINTKALVLHYHPTHRKQTGKMKITGPIDVRGFSATTGRAAGNPMLMTGQDSGFVYVEDRTFADGSGLTPINVEVRTRELYLAGMGGTDAVERVWVRHLDDPTSTVSLQPYLRESDSALDTTSVAAQAFSTANAGLAEIPFSAFSESAIWRMTEPNGGSGMRVSAILIDHTPHGRTEPR